MIPVALLLILQDVTWEPVGEHPAAITQSTDDGKALVAAFEYAGKIYWGYGDWTKNTGPIQVYALDAATLVWSREFSADTENISLFRRLSNGRLYVPHIDPRGGDATYSRRDPAGWTSRRVFDVYHVFDIIEFKGKLYMVGSTKPDNGVVLYLDEAAGRATEVQKATDANRYYLGGVLGDKLYVLGTRKFDDPKPVAKAFDGAAWKDAPELAPGSGVAYAATPFAGQLVFFGSNPGWPGPVYAFDGARTETAKSGAVCFTIYGQSLYVLMADGTVEKTADLRAWTTVVKATVEGARSIAMAQGRAFIGARGAKVYRTSATVAPVLANPVASFTYAKGKFDASASKGTVFWDFDDGSRGEGAVVTHTYAASGHYLPGVIVIDDNGLVGVCTQSVTIGPTIPPPRLVNGGFDQGQAGWTGWEKGEIELGGTKGAKGAALRLTAVEKGKREGVSQDLPVARRKTYVIGAMMKSELTGGAFAQAQLRWKDKAGKVIATETALRTAKAGEWETLAAEACAPDGAATVELMLRVSKGAGVAWIDAVTFEVKK